MTSENVNEGPNKDGAETVLKNKAVLEERTTKYGKNATKQLLFTATEINDVEAAVLGLRALVANIEEEIKIDFQQI